MWALHRSSLMVFGVFLWEQTGIEMRSGPFGSAHFGGFSVQVLSMGRIDTKVRPKEKTNESQNVRLLRTVKTREHFPL